MVCGYQPFREYSSSPRNLKLRKLFTRRQALRSFVMWTANRVFQEPPSLLPTVNDAESLEDISTPEAESELHSHCVMIKDFEDYVQKSIASGLLKSQFKVREDHFFQEIQLRLRRMNRNAIRNFFKCAPCERYPHSQNFKITRGSRKILFGRVKAPVNDAHLTSTLEKTIHKNTDYGFAHLLVPMRSLLPLPYNDLKHSGIHIE